MAGNTNTLSKKTIVAIVIAIVLLFVASLSVGIFLANRGDAEAAGGNQISDVNQTENNNQNTSSDNNQAPDQNTNIENNNTDSNNTENNNTENNNPETPNTDGNAGTVVDNNKTTNNNTNNNGTVNNAENNTENRTNNNTAGVTTDANVNQVGETTVTRVEERERLVSRDYWDWWTPTSVAVASTATRLSPTTPDITVEKTAMTEAGKNVVYAGQKITYTITVKNSGKKDVEKIEVTDKIPSNTTFESVENDGTVIKSENEEILGVKWLVDVKTGETTSVKFTVIVNENIEGTISNIAVANGEESNEENTAIITSEKTSEINRDGQKVEIAKVGDEIKYTITLNNTGKVDGITTISDKVPEGTELKANSAEGAKISDNNDMLLWENISVPAEGTISKSFVVIVKNIDSLKANKISNVATVGGKDTNPTEDTAATDITVTKVWKNMDSDAAKANIIDSIKLQLKVNGEVADEAVVTADEDWTHTFTDLPMYDENENKITYTIDEVVANIEDQAKLDLYNKSIENGVITNTFDPSKLTDTTEVSATKVWANMNSDAARENTITSIKLQVKANGEVAADQVVTADEDWTHTFTDLPVYDKAGNRITYTIDEVVANAEDQTKLDLYVKTIDQAKGIITNTFDPSKVQDEKITLIMTKVWQDNNNLFNTRPLEVKLTVDNKEYKLTGDMNAEKWTAETAELKKYDEQGNLINYTATENTVPTGYEKVSEEGLTVTNRANELISKTAYKVDANGNIGSPATNKDTFAANETVYYKITLTNAGSEPISKTVTDEIPLRLTLNTVDGKTGESGTTDKGDNWTVTKNDKKQSVVTWEVTNLAAREARELIIKATVVAEAEYKDICNKTIDGITANTAKLFVRKDGKVPYEGSGTGYDASLYTGELGTVYLNSSDLHYDTNANLKNDDLYYLIKNNNIITDMVAKGITRTQLVDALKTNGTTLADDEVVVWYVIKNESDGYHIDGVIRKISSLTEITNTAFTDKVSSDSTIKLEDIEIGQRGSITVKSITSSTDTVSTPMDVVFVLDTSGSMTYPLKGKNETAVENSRAKAMVNAVNSSIKTIMSKNKESRVGVVGFSGDASTIIPLGNYAQNIDYLTREYSAGGLMYSSSQTIKSNVGNKLSRQVTGGTNTQSGIKLGAEMLTSNQNTTTATVILKDGTTKTITRTPLLILVTDGKPTYYYDNATATGKVNGYGYTNETNENYYYWTLRTAKYYKDQITNKYYPKNTDKTAKVFTIGIGLKGNEAVAMLDPTEKNVNACNNNNSQQKALYKLITDNGKIAPGAYSYATGSKTGEITESDLTGFLNTSIDSSTDNEKNRAITTEESKARRVELGTINEEKEFSLTVGTDSYTSLKAAMKAGYVKKATSTTYYLDLSEISRSTNVEIVYWN